MAVALFRKKLCLHLKHRFFQQCRTGYVVLLPEVSPESQDQNPLFKLGMPNVESLTPENCVNTLGKYLLDFEHCVREVENELITSKGEEKEEKKDVFETVLEPLEVLGAPLDSTWGLVKTLYLTDSKIMPPETYLPLHDRARRARCLKFNSYYIYKAFKELDTSKLTEEEQRVANKFLTEGRLNGIELVGEQKLLLAEILRKLTMEKDNFRKRASISANLFKSRIDNPEVTRRFPPHLLEAMAVDKNKWAEGPWEVTLEPNLVSGFLEHCPDRDMRCNVWLASRQVASFQSVSELNNSTYLEKIRSLRRDLAKCLGYESFMHMSMETKMAGSVDKVQNMLSLLLEKAMPAQQKEIESLQKFASESGFKVQLKEWDIAHWAYRQKKYLFNWDENEIQEHLPYEKVFSGLVTLCGRLLSVRLEEVQGAPTWHPDVKLFHVISADSPKPVAALYLDPFAREGKLNTGESVGHVVAIRPSARVYDPVLPLAALVFNFTPPTKEKPSLLTFSAVDTFFRKFGQGLQHLLSSVTYSEVSGLSNVEWDAVDIVSNIMSLWLADKEVLKSISGHYKTDSPHEALERVAEVRNHMAGYNLCRELYLSNLDLRLHTTKEFWMVVAKDLWSSHFVITQDKDDFEPCGLTNIIAGDYSGAYYSRLWARVLAADAFTSFSAEDVGDRLRDTFLAFGGSCHPSEVFRRFQGRDPSPEAFLRLVGFTQKEEAPQEDEPEKPIA